MDLLKSKKFQVALASVIVLIVAHFLPEISETEVTNFILIVLGWFFGQGLADFGKEGKK